MPAFASVDVGSNTVHLLIAQPVGRGLARIRNESEWLGLGEAVEREGRIPDPLVQRLVETMTRFSRAALAEGAKDMYAFGTEAIRVAGNRDEVVSLIRKHAELNVELITGRREAEFAFAGVSLDTDVPAEPAAFVEVGGGSVQLARVHGTSVEEDTSLPLGTGRLTARFGLTFPATLEHVSAMRAAVDEQINDAVKGLGADSVIASGGVVRGIWKALHPDGDKTIVARELDYLTWASTRLSAEVIARRFDVKLKRAATLLPGCIVYRSVLRALGAEKLRVSEHGVREGAILDLISGKVNSCRV